MHLSTSMQKPGVRREHSRTDEKRVKQPNKKMCCYKIFTVKIQLCKQFKSLLPSCNGHERAVKFTSLNADLYNLFIIVCHDSPCWRQHQEWPTDTPRTTSRLLLFYSHFQVSWWPHCTCTRRTQASRWTRSIIVGGQYSDIIISWWSNAVTGV